MKAYNTHQILYAKNFYAHSGDIIADMRKVCQLDNPNWNFTNPTQILKFMSKQYLIWLDNTTEVEKEEHPKVAWDNNPIRAEMWAILNAYGVFIPMTQIHNYIDALPRYDVLKPQYNVIPHYGSRDNVFTTKMTTEQLVEKAKEILNISNVDLIDILADECCQKFDYEKASKLLSEFGENVSADELSEELWDGYSYLVGMNLNDDGTLPEKYYHTRTKHFSIEIRPMFKPNHTFEFEINLIPFTFEYTSKNIYTIDNILDEMVECIDIVIVKYMTSGAAKKIAAASTKLYNDNSELWDVPQHLVGDEWNLIDEMKDSCHLDKSSWEYYRITKENKWEQFEKATDEFSPSGFGGGCFRTDIYNVDGHMKVVVSFETLFDCAISEGKLWNTQSMFIDSPYN